MHTDLLIKVTSNMQGQVLEVANIDSHCQVCSVPQRMT